MDAQLLMKTASLAGEIMLKSGAETYRVEDTMRHILKTAPDIESVDVLVIMTGINATLKLEKKKAVTAIKRVEGVSINLNRIVEVNNISRKYCGNEISLEMAYEEPKSINSAIYSSRFYDLAYLLINLGFVLFFGGGFMELIMSTCVSILFMMSLAVGKDIGLNSFLQDVFSSIVIAISSMLFNEAFAGVFDADVVMIAAIMPLVPGMAITNGVRDTLRGDYLSGVARILEAFLKAAAVAIGIGLGIALFGRI